MLVEEYKDGNCTIKIYDDYVVKTQEEVDAILKELGQIVARSQMRQIMKEMKQQ